MGPVQACDHTSVGILVKRDACLLLIERARPPYGLAPPAGHVDGSPSFEEAARRELYEEVGLRTSGVRLLAAGRKQNPCRRPGGSWHYWKVYEAIDAVGDIHASPDEAKRSSWATRSELEELANRSRNFRLGKISNKDWERSPGLEPVWEEWLTELSLV